MFFLRILFSWCYKDLHLQFLKSLRYTKEKNKMFLLVTRNNCNSTAWEKMQEPESAYAHGWHN